jgi:hypothetical protein
MSEKPPDDLVHTLRGRGAHYVVGIEGHPIAVLLTPGEYDHLVRPAWKKAPP